MITVWECELHKNAGLNARLDALADEIVRAGELKSQREAFKRKTRMEAKMEREEILRRQAVDKIYMGANKWLVVIDNKLMSSVRYSTESKTPSTN